MPPLQSDAIEVVSVLPLRNSVFFPASVMPINVGRARSVKLVEDLIHGEKSHVVVVSQKDVETEDPGWDELAEIGTLAKIVKIVRLGPSHFSVVLHGIVRVSLKEKLGTDPYLIAQVLRVEEKKTFGQNDLDIFALAESLRTQMKELMLAMQNTSKEVDEILENVKDPANLVDLIVSNLHVDQMSLPIKQKVLECIDLKERLELVLSMVNKQNETLQLRRRVTNMVVDESKSQRERVLRDQIRQIRSELGEDIDDDEIEVLRSKLLEVGLSDDALKISKKQLARMSVMSAQSAEYNVARSYLEWFADLPWNKTTADKIDVEDCRRCLEEDHFGLTKVKKRIVEYMAVRKLRSDKKGPILCFVGPPGVGKTSLGKSIARSMGRRYHRIALGGVRDESEIRGHRRTYVGAMPGRIISAMKKVGVQNPVFVLDEIDKMGADSHGDPSSALLEVLDPAQNDSFQDHYIDTPFNLSQVTFIATANDIESIPAPLLDRLEVIEVTGYTRQEKWHIVKEHLAPKQISYHGLNPEQLEFSDDGIELMIEAYTKEAGVRGLEREVAAVCRYVVMRIVEGERASFKVDSKTLEKILGPHRYSLDMVEKTNSPGVVTGLAWTPAGGDILFVEATKMPGKGDIKMTGNLRSVMHESAVTAMSFVRSHAGDLHLDPEFLKHIDIHLHVPKGGIPKDGPSAGITMFAAISSLLLSCPVDREIAMTGEITLRGTVLPVGGIKEKLLAAHRAGIKRVIMSSRNQKDLEDVPDDVRQHLEIKFVDRVDQILPLVLVASLDSVGSPVSSRHETD